MVLILKGISYGFTNLKETFKSLASSFVFFLITLGLAFVLHSNTEALNVNVIQPKVNSK